MVCVGGGGGGASGSRRPTGTASLAGGAGSNGTVVFSEILASALNNTETVTIGAGGTGGAAKNERRNAIGLLFWSRRCNGGNRDEGNCRRGGFCGLRGGVIRLCRASRAEMLGPGKLMDSC